MSVPRPRVVLTIEKFACINETTLSLGKMSRVLKGVNFIKRCNLTFVEEPRTGPFREKRVSKARSRIVKYTCSVRLQTWWGKCRVEIIALYLGPFEKKNTVKDGTCILYDTRRRFSRVEKRFHRCANCNFFFTFRIPIGSFRASISLYESKSYTYKVVRVQVEHSYKYNVWR